MPYRRYWPSSNRLQAITHLAAKLLFVLLVLVFPLPLYWIWLNLAPDPIYVEFKSLVWYFSDTVVFLFLMVVALATWQQRSFKRDFIPAIAIPLALLPVLALFSAIWAVIPPLATYTAVRLLALWLLYLAVVALRPSPRLVHYSLAASLIIQAAVALLQVVYQHDVGLRFLGELDLVPTRGFTSIIIVGGRNWLRAYGLTPHPNILGGLLAVFILALFPAYLQSQRWPKVAWLAALLLGGSALIVALSRAAWLGVTLGGVMFLAGVWLNRGWRQDYGRSLLLPITAALLLLLVFGFTQRDLFMSRLTPPTTHVESRSLDERKALTTVSLYLLRRYPLLLGLGAGNFSAVLERLDPGLKDELTNQADIASQPVHNLPLLLTNELGLAGGALWLWLMLAPLVIAWRRLRSNRLTLDAWALTAALLALAVTDLLDFYSWGWAQGRLLRWLCLALWSNALNQLGSSGFHGVQPVKRET